MGDPDTLDDDEPDPYAGRHEDEQAERLERRRERRIDNDNERW
jgi:hypothetical protein